jgi:hypothetical protein
MVATITNALGERLLADREWVGVADPLAKPVMDINAKIVINVIVIFIVISLLKIHMMVT